MARRGRFIVFEGGEGSGKSTQAALLAADLGAELTREPGGTPLGEAVRNLCLHTEEHGELDARAELLLMVAARAQHVATRIEPWLAGGHDVVCDRYSGSTLAYQGYGRGLDLEMVRAACVTAEQGVRADLTVLLDVAVAISLSRMAGIPDRIEAEDARFHQRVTSGFRALAAADPATWVVVDAAGDRQHVAALVRQEVDARLGPSVQRR